MTTSTIKPSDIVLRNPPLVGTMGRAECEFAAAVIVRTCQIKNPDEWQPVTPGDVGAMITHDQKHRIEPMYSCCNNPFFRPDFDRLVESGFARWIGEPADVRDRKGPIELTTEGITAAAKHRDTGYRLVKI